MLIGLVFVGMCTISVGDYFYWFIKERFFKDNEEELEE